MVHKTLKPGDQDTFIQLELSEEEGQLIPEQVLYLVERIKENSQNFDKKVTEQSTNNVPVNNSAHLFIKLHLWQEDHTITTLTIVDMAGYPAQTSPEQANVGSPRNHLKAYSDNHSEVNTSGVNYLMYVFKDMMFKGNTKGKGKPLHGNTHSKILKEFTHLVTTGTNKLSFMQFCAGNQNLAKTGK